MVLYFPFMARPQHTLVSERLVVVAFAVSLHLLEYRQKMLQKETQMGSVSKFSVPTKLDFSILLWCQMSGFVTIPLVEAEDPKYYKLFF